MANVGGIKEVSGNQNSVEIDDLARFAVAEHNKKEVRFSILKILNSVIFCGWIICLSFYHVVSAFISVCGVFDLSTIAYFISSEQEEEKWIE